MGISYSYVGFFSRRHILSLWRWWWDGQLLCLDEMLHSPSPVSFSWHSFVPYHKYMTISFLGGILDSEFKLFLHLLKEKQLNDWMTFYLLWNKLLWIEDFHYVVCSIHMTLKCQSIWEYCLTSELNNESPLLRMTLLAKRLFFYKYWPKALFHALCRRNLLFCLYKLSEIGLSTKNKWSISGRYI